MQKSIDKSARRYPQVYSQLVNILVLAAGCAEPSTDSGDAPPLYPRPCVDVPHHRCGELTHHARMVSCERLADGVVVDDGAVYRLTNHLGDAVAGVRRDGMVSAGCIGTTTLDVWTVSGEGGGVIETTARTCSAMDAGILWPLTASAFSVEAMTAAGAVLLVDAYVADGRLWARSCPSGARWVRVLKARGDASSQHHIHRRETPGGHQPPGGPIPLFAGDGGPPTGER